MHHMIQSLSYLCILRHHKAKLYVFTVKSMYLHKWVKLYNISSFKKNWSQFQFKIKHLKEINFISGWLQMTRQGLETQIKYWNTVKYCIFVGEKYQISLLRYSKEITGLCISRNLVHIFWQNTPTCYKTKKYAWHNIF
jgi:hypothetical protein